MKNQLHLLKLTVLLLFVNSIQAQNVFEPYATAIWIDTQPNVGRFYNTSFKSPNGFVSDSEHSINTDRRYQFGIEYLGTHLTSSGTLRINGVEVRTFKKEKGNVCGAELNYRFYQKNSETKPSFQKNKLSFLSECNTKDNMFNDAVSKGPCNTSGYQKWHSPSLSADFEAIDLTNVEEGQYTLEVFYKIWGGENGGCSTDKLDNNLGKNYTADFTICSTFGVVEVEHATCDNLGKLKFNVMGLKDGIYNNHFFYEKDGKNLAFTDVEIKDGVVVIPNLKPMEYANIKYISPNVEPCPEFLIAETKTISIPQDCGLIDNQYFKTYATAVWINQKGVVDSFYNTSYKSPNGFYLDKDHAINQDSKSFDSHNFGMINTQSGNLKINGAEVRTFKKGLGNVCGASLNYRVYSLSASDKPEFTAQKLSFFAECNTGEGKFNDPIGKGPCNTSGYQKLQGLSFSNTFTEVDLTNRNEGVYALELYYEISGSQTGGCAEKEYDNNKGENYKASFVICPTFVSSHIAQPTSAGEKGTILFHLKGVPDGVYSDRFMYTNGTENSVFQNVEVKSGVATIKATAGTYKNIRYNSQEFGGCSDIGGIDVIIEKSLSCELTKEQSILNVLSQLGVEIEYSTDNGTFQLANNFSGLKSGLNTIRIRKTDGTVLFSEDINLECTLGSNRYELKDEVQVYPNPIQNQLFIKVSDETVIQSIEIYTSQGQLVITGLQSEIDVSNLPKGMYIVQVQTDKGITSTKVVKE